MRRTHDFHENTVHNVSQEPPPFSTLIVATFLALKFSTQIFFVVLLLLSLYDFFLPFSLFILFIFVVDVSLYSHYSSMDDNRVCLYVSFFLLYSNLNKTVLNFWSILRINFNIELKCISPFLLSSSIFFEA